MVESHTYVDGRPSQAKIKAIMGKRKEENGGPRKRLMANANRSCLIDRSYYSSIMLNRLDTITLCLQWGNGELQL